MHRSDKRTHCCLLWLADRTIHGIHDGVAKWLLCEHALQHSSQPRTRQNSLPGQQAASGLQVAHGACPSEEYRSWRTIYK
jgi:hypothetical protein